MKNTLEILFEDDQVVVVNKPAGLLTLPDRYLPDIPNLRSMLLDRFGDIFTVHRLDRDTGGVLVFAKNAEAHKSLNDQFEHREVRKIYHALVSGIVEQDELAIDIPIEPDLARKGLMRPSARGKESLTLVKVLKRFRGFTLLECDLRTGRQHQIRVHCSAIGHPLVVDPQYGGGDKFLVSSIKRRFNLQKFEEEKPLIDRLTLQSVSLEFSHPISGEKIIASAPYPKDFRAIIQVLEKYAPHRTEFSWADRTSFTLDS